MENKSLLAILFLFAFFGCTNLDYQKIIINNDKKTISLLDSNFVIDSISVEKFGKAEYSISLNNKSLGKNSIILTKDNQGYNVYNNNLKSLDCNDDNLSLSIIIRKKGTTTRVTENMAMNYKVNADIQVLRSYTYHPCSKKIDTLETDRSFK
jgi:hypothetical protein